MQITGQIQNVQPHMKDGFAETFTTANGQFFVFDMLVNGTEGTINSKSAHYPKNIGDEITVNVLPGEYGNKLKAVNPQYQNQQQAPQQGGSNFLPKPTPPQQGYQPPSQQPPQQQDSVQDRIAFAQAYNRACDEYNVGKVEQEQIQERTRIHYKVLTTRQVPFEMSLSGPQQPAPQAPPPQPDPPFDPTDDIPF